MARTALTTQKFTTKGLEATYVAPHADGVSFRNSGKQLLHVKNGSGSSINVTLKIGKTVQGQTVAAPVVAVAAGDEMFFGPFPDDYDQQDGTDNVYVDFSAVTDVTVAALGF